MAMDADDALQIQVPGRPIEKEVNLKLILAKVRERCGWIAPTFPGSQPGKIYTRDFCECEKLPFTAIQCFSSFSSVSLTRSNMREINRIPYVACEKTDGVRYLFFAGSKGVFLIDRNEKGTEDIERR